MFYNLWYFCFRISIMWELWLLC